MQSEYPNEGSDLKKIVVGSSDQHFDKLTVSHHEGQVIINSTVVVKTSSIATIYSGLPSPG